MAVYKNDEIKSFLSEGKKYYLVNHEYKGEKQISFYDENLNTVLRDSSIENASQNAQIIDENEKKELIKKSIDMKKEQEKNIKNIEKDIKDNNSNIDINEINKKLEDNNIKEGNFYEINVKDPDTNEESKAYFQIFKDKKGDLRLGEYTKNKEFRGTGDIHTLANAETLSGCSAYSLLDNSFASRRICAKYLQNNPDIETDFVSKKLELKFKDITEKVKKSEIRQTKERKEITVKNKNPNSYELETVNKIPDAVKEFYDKNNRQINEKIYTQKLFDMFKKISSIPDEDRNINVQEKKLFNPLFNALNKYKDDELEQKKIFSNFVFNNNHKNNGKGEGTTESQIMTIAGHLFEKQFSPDFKGFEKKRSGYEKSERNKNVDSIMNNTFPIMKKQENIDYIYNPENNSIYHGNNQIAAQRNKAENGYDTNAYAINDSLIKNNPESIKKGYKLKCELVDYGLDAQGKRHFGVIVPVKPSLSERFAEWKEKKKEEKKEKDRKKEEYRRNVQDAKYVKKYDELPVYKTSIQPIPENQPALIKKEEVKHITEKPTNDTTLENKIKYDFENYFRCMFTKETFTPSVDWTEEKNKQDLLNYAKNYPERLTQMANKTYENVAEQIRQQYRTNDLSNTLVNALTNENKTENTHKRKI